MQAPFHIIHHKRRRYARRLGFQETPQRISQQFVEVCRPTFLDVGLRPRRQLGRQFCLDHGFIHKWKLARPPHARKDESGARFGRLRSNRKERKELKDPESRSSLRSLISNLKSPIPRLESSMSNLKFPMSLLSFCDTNVQPMASAYSRIRAWTVLCSKGLSMS